MDRNQEINIEKDFWDDFIVEAFENIDEIEQNAMLLEQNPDNTEVLHAMFRCFHTVKGLAGFVEHVIVQEIAHKTETMMDYCRKGILHANTDVVNMILTASDCIKTLCNDMNAYKDDAFMDKVEVLIDNLEKTSAQAENAQGAVVSDDNSQNSDETQSEVVENTEEQANVENQQDQGNFEQTASDDTGNGVDADLAQFSSEITEIQYEVEEKERQHEQMVHDAQEHQLSVQEEQVENNVVQEVAAVQEPQFVQVEVEQVAPQNIVQPVVQGVVEVPPAPVSDAIQQQIEEANINKDDENINDEDYSRTDSSEEEPQKELNPFQKEVLRKLLPNVMVSSDDSSVANRSVGNDEYMKVANYKIDHLVDIIGELIINQALVEQNIIKNHSDDKQLTSDMSGFLRVTRDLQGLSMSLRMVSLKSTFQKLARIARDTIQQLKKDVEFVMTGETTEIDRAVAERLLEPLVHMIKNAISHGVEKNPEDRVALGKPRKARVELNAYNKRGKIYIEVKDDGRGINTDVVYKKALEKGIIDPDRQYSQEEIKEFIMLPGFSTAEVVDNISGRGVGMDVVNTQIQKTGGRVEIISNLNEGSTFVLEVPVNHSIMNGTIIEMNDQYFVVPTINVKEFLQPKEEQWVFTKQERTMIKVRDNLIPIIPLSVFFGSECEEPKEVPLVMVLELEQELRAVPIVDVISRQEIVVKPVGEEFQNLRYISGMSILGSGNVSLILDIDYLFKKEVK
ncbi:MAG: chemotaxis protein CheW [Candidatus Gastranaerophilaceae bacterium]